MTLRLLAGICLSLHITTCLSEPANEIVRPKYEIDLSNPYSTDSVPIYAGDHKSVYQHIDDNINAHTEALQRWMRQPSISAQNVGIREMAELVRSDLEAIGFQEAELVETEGHPGVWGYYDAGAEKTLMVYMMYDVQPVNPEDWRSPPFAAELVDTEVGKAIMARAATNQKGPQRAFLNAVESIIQTEGKLPVNLMITAEGEEELGSPNYPQVIDKYEDRLRTASAVIFPMSGQNAKGQVRLVLGVKGIIYFELEANGGDWGGPTKAEIHGSYKAITDSPVLRLMQAISSLVSEDGNTILVEGYYDDVRPPTEQEQSLIAGYLAKQDPQLLKQLMSVDRWIDDLSGLDLLHELIYTPTMNIDGIWSGYTGEGVKTILPHRATAKMDSRLPVGINSSEALAKIRKHLDRHGFEDIKLTVKSNYPASQTSVEADIVQAAISVYKKYGEAPTINPRLAGSAPFYQFTQRLGLPMIPVGLGHGRGAHAPNEYYVVQSDIVAGLAEIEKAYVDLLYAFSQE
jgi:acetylornithine deacetylase/succinyl-diaminopimelate desuccinylase-like protein